MPTKHKGDVLDQYPAHIATNVSHELRDHLYASRGPLTMSALLRGIVEAWAKRHPKADTAAIDGLFK